jgi:hypothetical protein
MNEEAVARLYLVLDLLSSVDDPSNPKVLKYVRELLTGQKSG